MVKVIQKFQDCQFPLRMNPFSTVKKTKLKFFLMCIGNYCFPYNFEKKLNVAKIPVDLN